MHIHFHRPDWRALRSQQYDELLPRTDTDVITRVYTLILYRCNKCGAHRIRELNGSWDIEDLT